MSFNYGVEKKKFDREWARLRTEYEAAGMTEAAIEEIYGYDWKQFNEERAYRNHTQELPDSVFNDVDGLDEGKSPLLKRFMDVLAVMPAETSRDRRDSWIEEIESEWLSKALLGLPERDIHLLTLYVYEGYSITEIAQIQGVSRPTVSKKIRRIKNFLKKIG